MPHEPEAPLLGRRLYELRQGLGWSLREAARRIGLSHVRLHEVENGVHARSGLATRPSYDLILRLAAVYLVDPEELLKLAGYPLPEAPQEPERRLLDAYRRLSPERQQALLHAALCFLREDEGGTWKS